MVNLKFPPSFNQIFVKNDPFGNDIFSSKMEEKTILMGISGYFLDKETFLALEKTAKEFNEKDFFISETECLQISEIKNFKKRPFSSYERYVKSEILLENAQYSEVGRWGILISQEEFGIMGATAEFMEVFKRQYPPYAQQMDKFDKCMAYKKQRYNADLDWVKDFKKNF